MIKVIIVDDQLILTDSLKYIIEKDSEIEVIGCAKNGKEALELCGNVMPDVVLMDILMPECDGIEGVRLIKSQYNSVRVIMLTTFNDEKNISKALENGADGYILKDITGEELVMAIKNTAKGFGIIHKKTYDAIVKKMVGDDETNNAGEVRAHFNLDEREMEIIRLIVENKTNKEIAAALFISEGRLKNIITGILTKLKLKDRIQLVVFAFKNNLV